MSFFCSIFKYKGGPLLSNIASRHFFTAYNPLHPYRNGMPQKLEDGVALSCADVGKLFIRALVLAGRCSTHAPREASASSPGHTLRLPVIFFSPRKEALHTKSSCRSALPAPDKDRQEMLDMVDFYVDSWEEEEPVTNTSNLQNPDLIISNKIEDPDSPEEDEEESSWRSFDEDVNEKIKLLEMALEAARRDEPHEDIYSLYAALPSPRVPYLTTKCRHHLLRHLGLAERDKRTMLQYLCVVDDMKVTGTPLAVWQWNLVIHLAGKFVAEMTEVELENGLRIWRDMEREAGVTGNHVTFNILFDMAIKAGKFHLADMIHDEMLRRGHILNRFHRLSRIYYHGLRSDGESARKSYKEFIEAGEIVDTAVLNCLIVSLFNSQEPQPALQVYERMKILHAKKSHQELPPTRMKQKRELRKALVVQANIAKNNELLRDQFQSESIVAPDVITFRTLLDYYAIQVGDLDQVIQLLDEMNWYQVPPHGSIYIKIFRAFAIHGGIKYSAWTREKLQTVWEAFIKSATDLDTEDVYLAKWVIIWALRAFKKCEGNEAVLAVWEEAKGVWWSADEEQYGIVAGVVRALIDNDDARFTSQDTD